MSKTDKNQKEQPTPILSGFASTGPRCFISLSFLSSLLSQNPAIVYHQADFSCPSRNGVSRKLQKTGTLMSAVARKSFLEISRSPIQTSLIKMGLYLKDTGASTHISGLSVPRIGPPCCEDPFLSVSLLSLPPVGFILSDRDGFSLCG